MKRIFSLLLFFLFAFCLSAQQPKITSIVLKNKMEVLMCEDHSQPKIYGAICVHAGSKNDPLDNTGMAHYLEHIMFKGTDQIGTTDWKAEKVYLDSISLLYDQIHEEKDASIRNKTMMKINELSNKATEYAIPNEVDVILSKMGGEGINAFTSNDVTVYHNKFPSNQLEKWLLVYKERFRNPIFRLFQSELEAVYEEYNMYSDEPMSVFMEDALKAAYGEHPYGRPVIGYPEHLKNPQPSAMQKFFNTYYQPSNMTLVLVGDFNAAAIQPLLERTIGTLRNEAAPASAADKAIKTTTLLNQPIQPFKGHQVVTVSETPVKVGVVGFQTVGANQPDALLLDVMSGLLNNDSGTGLLDELSQKNKLLVAQGFNYGMLESGVFACFYVPKIIGQSHDDAEALVMNVIDRLKKGDYGDDLFEAVKMDYLREYEESMENLEREFYNVLEITINGLAPEDFYKKADIIRNLKKEDLTALAQKYFGDDMLSFRSNMGSKKFEKLKKPAWKPIVAKNAGESSEFAKGIENLPVKDLERQHFDFKKDVQIIPINDSYTLCAAQNPTNDIFTLNLIFNYGEINDPALDYAAEYFSQQGSKELDYNKLQLSLQKMGAAMDVYSDNENLTIAISGFDKDLEKILNICSTKILNPSNDETVLESIIEERKSEIQTMKSDASSWGSALFDYARYGQNSPSLNTPSLKEIKQFTGTQLLKIFKTAIGYNADITFVGNVDPREVAAMLQKTGILLAKPQTQPKPFLKLKTYDEPTIFIASNKKFLQSNIYFYNTGRMFDKDKWPVCMAYNEYMGGSMAGIIFQEIRELRSLGYSAYGACSYDRLLRNPSYIIGYLGTQADKTLDGCAAMTELLVNFPEKPEKFDLAKTSLLQQRSYVSFRGLPGYVLNLREMGYSYDPREETNKKIEELSFEDMHAFFKEYLKNNNMVITIAGDKKRIDLKELRKLGKVVELKYNDFVTE